MTEFHSQLRARAREALTLLGTAEQQGDHYGAAIQRADLDDIARIAHEHDLVVPELTGLGSAA